MRARARARARVCVCVIYKNINVRILNIKKPHVYMHVYVRLLQHFDCPVIFK